jgi:hypothetical protein
MTAAQPAAAPPALPPEEIADAVTILLTDPTLAGRTMICQHNQPRRPLLPDHPWPELLDTLG